MIKIDVEVSPPLEIEYRLLAVAAVEADLLGVKV
jgi:hypothetical protein